MKVNSKDLIAYMGTVRENLTDEWVAAADRAIIGHETVGHVARQYAFSCYMRGTKAETCAEQIRKKFQ